MFLLIIIGAVTLNEIITAVKLRKEYKKLKNKMITIHWDFTDGTEISYIEGLNQKDNFNTNCLNFFSLDIKASDVVVVDKLGNNISRNKLLFNDGTYTSKQIKPAHNIYRMLIAGSFEWEKPKENQDVRDIEIFLEGNEENFLKYAEDKSINLFGWSTRQIFINTNLQKYYNKTFIFAYNDIIEYSTSFIRRHPHFFGDCKDNIKYIALKNYSDNQY